MNERPLDLTGGGDDKEGDAEPAKPKRDRSGSSGGRPAKAPSEADLRKRIEDGIGEVVEFVARYDEELAEIVRADAPKMAEVLAARATRHARVARVLARLFGKDSWVAFVRAFGPTARALLERLRAGRAAAGEEPLDAQQGGVHVGP